MYHKILVPLDGSELAEKALAHAAAIARCGQGKLILLRVIPPPDPFSAAEMTDQQASVEKERLARGQAESYLETVRGRPELKELVQSTLVPSGNPAEEILDFALSEKADLLVISSHGRTGLGRFLLGSVAERVSRHSPCPVMIVAAEHAAPA